jgi:SIT4 phosphatase-associated protein
MLAFIQAQPSIIERLLRHIETPAFADLLMRIVQLDEQDVGEGVLEVCPLFTCSYPLTLKARAVAFSREPHVSFD